MNNFGKSGFLVAGRFEGDFSRLDSDDSFFLNKRLGCWSGRLFFRRLVWNISTIDERRTRGRRDVESEREREKQEFIDYPRSDVVNGA